MLSSVNSNIVNTRNNNCKLNEKVNKNIKKKESPSANSEVCFRYHSFSRLPEESYLNDNFSRKQNFTDHLQATLLNLSMS